MDWPKLADMGYELKVLEVADPMPGLKKTPLCRKLWPNRRYIGTVCKARKSFVWVPQPSKTI